MVDDRLAAVIERVEPPELADQLEHATLSGGKRVRPVLAMVVCEAAGGEPGDALDYAAGIELVHAASLVIDDVIDRSAVRRGVDSAWAAYGHGPALIASDGLLGEAFALFADEPAAMEVAARAVIELGEGEASELVAPPADEDEYLRLARRKTGALFRASARLGAIAAGADGEREAFGDYAEHVGIAFQIRDDVLDATADDDQLGKPAGRDAEMDRPSLVRVTGLAPEAAAERAQQEVDRGLEALSSVEVEDARAHEYLQDLAAFAVVRDR